MKIYQPSEVKWLLHIDAFQIAEDATERKMQVIKFIRDLSYFWDGDTLGLKDAKDFVEGNANLEFNSPEEKLDFIKLADRLYINGTWKNLGNR
mgnify:CR=1 FL=1